MPPPDRQPTITIGVGRKDKVTLSNVSLGEYRHVLVQVENIDAGPRQGDNVKAEKFITPEEARALFNWLGVWLHQ